MVARIALFLTLILTVIALIVCNLPKKEKVVFEVPPGYGKAEKVAAELPKSEGIVSALDYAQAFAPKTEAAPVVEKPVAFVKKLGKITKRRLAHAKSKRHVFLAKW